MNNSRNAIVQATGQPHPRISDVRSSEVVLRVLWDGSLEVTKSDYPEIPLGKYYRIKVCVTHGEPYHEITAIMKGCYAGNKFKPCSGEWRWK